MPLPPESPCSWRPLAYWPAEWWITRWFVWPGCSWLIGELVIPQVARLMPVETCALPTSSRIVPA